MNNTRGEKKLSEWYKGKQLGADLKASMLCLVKKLHSNITSNGTATAVIFLLLPLL